MTVRNLKRYLMRDPAKVYHNEDGSLYEGEITQDMVVIEAYQNLEGKVIYNVVLLPDDSPTLVG